MLDGCCHILVKHDYVLLECSVQRALVKLQFSVGTKIIEERLFRNLLGVDDGLYENKIDKF